MSFIYKTLNGVAQKFNNETYAFKQSADPDVNLEGFVKQGVLLRQDVLDNEGVLGENASELHVEMYQGTDGLMYVATNATQVGVGSLAKTGKAGDVVKACTTPNSINRAGNSIITASADVVIGAGGRLAESQVADVSLMSAVVGAASADFDNSVFATPSKAIVDTTVDAATARGATITLYYIDDTGSFVKETVVLNASDSSTDITTTGTVKKLLAVSSNQSILVVSLQVKNSSGALCKAIATPTANTIYGSVTEDDSSNPLGQSVQVSATTAPVADAVIVVKGTDDNSNELYETLVFDGVATSAITKKQFKSITQLLIGDDGVATNTYTIKVLANTSGQKIGVAPATNVPANSLFIVKR